MNTRRSLLLAILLCAAATARASSHDAAWIADIDTLARELPRLHANAFAHVTRAQFEDAVAALEARVPAIADHEVAVGMMQLVASIGDAHTAVAGFSFSRLPIGVDWFSDGLFVVRATEAQQDLIGMRVVSIGGRPIDEVAAAVGTTISHENESWLRDRMPDSIVSPAILHALGVIPSAAAARVAFDTGNRVIERELTPPLPFTPFVERPSGNDLPLYLRDRSTFYRYDYLPAERTLYMQYNACREISGLPFTSFLNDLQTFLLTHPIDRFVLDLRHNTGGSSSIMQPFITGLQFQPDLNRADRAFVLIGRRTFSSAVINAIELDKQTNATLVGEPTGGKPNAYGEVRSFVLPGNGLTVFYSTKFFELLPGNDAPSFMPDRLVTISSADYFAGRDPVLASILPRVPRRRAVR